MKNEHCQIGDTVYIAVRRKGKPKVVIKIDAEDLPKVEGYGSWHINGGRCGLQYAATVVGWPKRIKLMLHRIVNNTPDDQKCIFVSNDSFDCRKANLKNVEAATVRRSRGKSIDDKYIYTDRRSGRHKVAVWRDGAMVYLGSFATKEEARAVRRRLVC